MKNSRLREGGTGMCIFSNVHTATVENAIRAVCPNVCHPHHRGYDYDRIVVPTLCAAKLPAGEGWDVEVDTAYAAVMDLLMADVNVKYYIKVPPNRVSRSPYNIYLT